MDGGEHSQTSCKSGSTNHHHQLTVVQDLSNITADHPCTQNLVKNVTSKLRDFVEVIDVCNQEHERNGDVSTSDDDSVSLLHDLDACQSRGPAEDTENIGGNLQYGNKEQKKKEEMERNQIKAAEPGISSCTQSAAGHADSSSQSAGKVSQCVKIPPNWKKRNEKGETYLHKACKKGDLARVKMLIQAGISINMEDYAGWTALHEASAFGDKEVVEELLKAGANVNARSCDGVTPLHDATAAGHYEVVKLLLLHGSNARDRNIGGLSAVDMAGEEDIKGLLSLHVSFVHEQPREASKQYRQPGDLQLCSQIGCSDTANVQSRESDDRDRASERGDIQLRKKYTTTTDNQCHSVAITVVLEEVGRKQAEILAWPLMGRDDAGTYHAALIQIHNRLIEVLTKQHLERDSLAQKQRRVAHFLQQHTLKGQLFSLASHQKNLVKILQKHLHLVEVYVTTKVKLSTQPPSHNGSTAVLQQPDHFSTPASTAACSKARGAPSCIQNVHRKKSQTPVPQTRLLTPACPNSAKDLTVRGPPGPVLTQGKKTATHTCVFRKKASSCGSRASQLGNTLQNISFQMKGNNVLIQTRAEDNSRHLLELIQRGLVPCGSALQVLLKGHRHLTHVLCDGSIKDNRGRLHLAPESWLESILGNNIPVSSTYAWDKVTFRGKPLSYYLLNMESEGNKAETHHEGSVQHCRAASSQEALTTEAAGLGRLMKIKIIHLVNDEEMLPNAIMDHYWEKLLKTDFSVSDDWLNY